MAFTGVHIAFGTIDTIARSSDVLSKKVWSETMAAAGTTGLSANLTQGAARMAFLIQPSVDIFVSIGPTPNASASPRDLVLAGERVLIPCTYGDKLAWVGV